MKQLNGLRNYDAVIEQLAKIGFQRMFDEKWEDIQQNSIEKALWKDTAKDMLAELWRYYKMKQSNENKWLREILSGVRDVIGVEDAEKQIESHFKKKYMEYIGDRVLSEDEMISIIYENPTILDDPKFLVPRRSIEACLRLAKAINEAQENRLKRMEG